MIHSTSYITHSTSFGENQQLYNVLMRQSTRKVWIRLKCSVILSAWIEERSDGDALCFLKSRVSQSESSSVCCPSPCMHKTALKCTLHSHHYWTPLSYALSMHYITFASNNNSSPFFSYCWIFGMPSHPSNNLECTLFSKHANCIAFWCDSLPCVCHTDVTPLPLECINLRTAWNKWYFNAFNANKHKSHVICNSHIV